MPPDFTLVAVIKPMAFTITEPSSDSTEFNVRSPRPSKRMAPTVVLEALTDESAASSNSLSAKVACSPISSSAVSVINPPAVKSTSLLFDASLIEPVVAVIPKVPPVAVMLPTVTSP